ncbi:DNA-binding MarR family transcriptional regulator [Kribbella amoyensis]|uniref:DNA-binding MarR family transcriptional regulator n=1 Tax=Kribbella amoyensis TaxID=996641 RepID=A0A561BQP3_9ACTN|nr:MarR family transcriptional regulator [Kribbella amoyensis]TWD81171.1 DNA-binding MarR family transcriptional regulator [Kribbella amoyensis]
MERFGFELPLLLAGAFRQLIDELHRRLAEEGHADLRPAHGFALQAIGPDGGTMSEIGRRLGVSKQAATKTVGKLAELGYVERGADPGDARAVQVTITSRGREALRRSAEIFEDLRREWVRLLGRDRVLALEEDLGKVLDSSGGVALGDLPGWLR